MKHIRLNYQFDTGVQIDKEISHVKPSVHGNEIDYINWLEDKLEDNK